MKIKYISFIESSIVSMNQIHETVVDKFSQATNTQSQGFEFCSGHKELLSLLQDGFQTSNVIVLMTEISNYISTKGLLCKAMGLKCEKNKDILQTVESEKCISLLNQNQKDAQSAIPVGAETFITEDGLFSPFALKTSKQRLVMLPIDNKRITDKILGEIASFLEDGIEEYGSKIITAPAPEKEEEIEEEVIEEANDEVAEIEAEEENITETEDDIEEETDKEDDGIEDVFSDSSMEEKEDVVYPTEKPEFEDVSSSSYDDEIIEKPVSPYEKFDAISENDDVIDEEADNDNEEEIVEAEENAEEDTISEDSADIIENTGHNRSIIAETIGNLSQSSIRVAFAIQEGNNILDHYISSLIELKNASCFKTANVPNQLNITDEDQCKEAVSLAARTAMQKAKCMVGMAVSDVFADADGNDFVYAALSDVKKTNVYKIYALEGEDPDTLVETSINSIFEILNERVVAFNEKLALNGNTKKKMKKKKTMSAVVKILIWLAIVILLCAAIGILISSYFSGEGFIYELGEKIVSFFSSN